MSILGQKFLPPVGPVLTYFLTITSSQTDLIWILISQKRPKPSDLITHSAEIFYTPRVNDKIRKKSAVSPVMYGTILCVCVIQAAISTN